MASKKSFFNRTKQKYLARSSRVADSFWTRLFGLLGSRKLESGQGLYLIPCKHIHMLGMTYPIDCVFLDCQLRVTGLCQSICPGQFSGYHAKAIGCLELSSGTIALTHTCLGDEIVIGESIV